MDKYYSFGRMADTLDSNGTAEQFKKEILAIFRKYDCEVNKVVDDVEEIAAAHLEYISDCEIDNLFAPLQKRFDYLRYNEDKATKSDSIEWECLQLTVADKLKK